MQVVFVSRNSLTRVQFRLRVGILVNGRPCCNEKRRVTLALCRRISAGNNGMRTRHDVCLPQTCLVLFMFIIALSTSNRDLQT